MIEFIPSPENNSLDSPSLKPKFSLSVESDKVMNNQNTKDTTYIFVLHLIFSHFYTQFSISFLMYMNSCWFLGVSFNMRVKLRISVRICGEIEKKYKHKDRIIRVLFLIKKFDSTVFPSRTCCSVSKPLYEEPLWNLVQHYLLSCSVFTAHTPTVQLQWKSFHECNFVSFHQALF